MKSLLIHNPRCGKSRDAKTILEEAGVEFVVVEYLKDGLKTKLLENLPALTGLDYPELIRTKEEVYKELDLINKQLTKAQWIKTIQENPILLERPIFIHNNRAVVARPSERVKEIL